MASLAHCNCENVKAVSFLASKKEDSNLNQYWYSLKTIATMVKEIEYQHKIHTTTNCNSLDSATAKSSSPSSFRIAHLSTPSLYFACCDPHVKADSNLFDLDTQFGTSKCIKSNSNNKINHESKMEDDEFKATDEDDCNHDMQKIETAGFVKFDFNKCDQIPKCMHNKFDMIVIDPPFITKDVWICYHKAGMLICGNLLSICSLNCIIMVFFILCYVCTCIV